MPNLMKTYDEMLKYDTFTDRIKYLYLGDRVGRETFGSKRWVNQKFYTSKEWRDFRDSIIIRDEACDMALKDYPIFSQRRSFKSREKSGIILHHIEPCRYEDFLEDPTILMDPNNIVCVSYRTHRMIHYGIYEDLDILDMPERKPNDTCPWKGGG